MDTQAAPKTSEPAPKNKIHFAFKQAAADLQVRIYEQEISVLTRNLKGIELANALAVLEVRHEQGLEIGQPLTAEEIFKYLRDRWGIPKEKSHVDPT